MMTIATPLGFGYALVLVGFAPGDISEGHRSQLEQEPQEAIRLHEGTPAAPHKQNKYRMHYIRQQHDARVFHIDDVFRVTKTNSAAAPRIYYLSVSFSLLQNCLSMFLNTPQLPPLSLFFLDA